MPDFLSQLLRQVRTTWSRMDPAQRLQIGSVALAALVGLAALVWYAGRPDDLVAYRASSIEDLERVSAEMSRQGILHSIDGLELRVPRDDRTNLGRLSGFDAPKTDGPLFELLSGVGSLTHDSGTRATLRHESIEKNLEYELLSIRGVRTATVSVTMPDRRSRTVFRADQNPRRASVVIERDSTRTPSDFDGLAHSVSVHIAAATGIDPEFVTVTDAETNATYSGAQGSEGRGIGSLSEFEQRQKREAQAFLDQSLSGLRGVQGVVYIDFDRSIVDETRILRSEDQRMLSERTSEDPIPDNSPGVQAAGPSAPTPRVARTSTTRDIEYDPSSDGERRSQTRLPRIATMAIILRIAETMDPTSAEEIVRSIKETFKSDTYEVRVSHVFVDPNSFVADALVPRLISQPEVSTEPDAPEWAAYLPSIVRFGSVLAVLAFLYLMLRRTTPKKPKPPKRERTVAIPKPIKPEPELDPMLAQRGEVERQFQRDPNTVSRVLESWLTETKG